MVLANPPANVPVTYHSVLVLTAVSAFALWLRVQLHQAIQVNSEQSLITPLAMNTRDKQGSSTTEGRIWRQSRGAKPAAFGSAAAGRAVVQYGYQRGAIHGRFANGARET